MILYHCIICISTVPSERLGVLECGHAACAACLGPWLHKKKSCPTCRTPAKKFHRLFLGSLTEDAGPPHAVAGPSSSVHAEGDEAALAATGALENLGPDASAADLAEAQGLVEQAAGAAGVNAARLYEALDTFTRRIAPRLRELEEKLHDKRENIKKLQAKYAAAKQDRDAVLGRHEEFAHAAERALARSAQADQAREEARARMAVAIAERDELRKELAKIPSLKALQGEVSKYKEQADSNNRGRKKYKQLYSALEEENKLLKAQLERRHSPSSDHFTEAIKHRTKQVSGSTQYDESTTMVAFSDDEDDDQAFHAPDVQNKGTGFELFDDPAGGPTRATLFASSHPLTAQLSKSALKRKAPDSSAVKPGSKAVFGPRQRRRAG